MANIYVEAKGPKGVQAKESLLPTALSGYTRGLAVLYGADAYHALLASTPGEACLGILEEDAISVYNPAAVIEFGQAVANIGANVTAGQSLAVNANGQLVPASYGQSVVAVALETQTYASPGSFANVFVLGLAGFQYNSDSVSYLTASGAVPVLSGTYALNGAAALAMTLATPTVAQDGTRLRLVATTAHAHTLTAAADKIQGAKDTVTFAAVGDVVELEAVNTLWVVLALGGPTPAALSEV
jgi:hypothetical protein